MEAESETYLRRPDFFIVGAPKSGTTAMDQYLKQHPEIFLPDHKEPQFFGSDLHSSTFIRDEERYLALFKGVRDEKRVGETSVWSLYSEKASSEIKAFQPDASIIIMLRNPLDMIPSLHNQYLYTGNEDIDDLEDALRAEEDRKRGRCIPATATFIQGLFYAETARYARQLDRYLAVFGQDNVHIILFDDLKENPSRTYESTLQFLGVDPSFRPAFEVVNPSKRVRSKALRDLSKHSGKGARRVLKALIPRPVRKTMVQILDSHNTRYVTPQPADPEVMESLRTDFTQEVELLSEILGRDLGHWLLPSASNVSE